MKLIKRPIFWIVIAFLLFLGWVFLGYSVPAQVRFTNETKGDIKNIRLTSDSGELTIPILPVGESASGERKLPTGELKLTLENVSGRPHLKKFQHTKGPRQTVIFHIVDTDDMAQVTESRSSWVSTEESFTFNLRGSEQ